ncbi:MAG: flagellar hook-basal body complex protein FliE [Planctomycetes bacterium]|nr:flagellar hook-basal body complex protein FliE [Planctomycetota bacterium]
MVDNLQGLNAQGLLRTGGGVQKQQAAQAADGSDFKSLLMDSINEVNRLQSEADQASINLATGKTESVDEVFTAVKKAELAFQTLMQIQRKLLDAYDEIKQMRV